MMANRNRAGFGFLAPYDSHVRNFLHFGVANLGLELFVAVIERSADSCGAELRSDNLGIVRKFVAYRKNRHLHRSEPQRKSASVVLDKNAEESFHRTPESAMDH